jgi:hypothetical protein
MTEKQVRDVLARVVPEPPDSITDPSPVVRAGRRRRQRRAAGVTALAAVLVAGTALGVRSAGTDDKDLVADRPTPVIADPYATAPCPGVSEPWVSAPVDDLDDVVAVRYCARPFNGFPAAAGPADALVVGLAIFANDLRHRLEADPARCATVDVVPSDSRLLLQLSDGTFVGVPSGACQDVEVEGRTLDATEVTRAFLSTLAAQRREHSYVPSTESSPLDCTTGASVSPALPGHSRLVAAVVCPPSGEAGTAPTDNAFGALAEAWADGGEVTEDRDGCLDPEVAPTFVLARTDRGDTVRIEAGSCDVLYFQPWDPQSWFRLDATPGDVGAS